MRGRSACTMIVFAGGASSHASCLMPRPSTLSGKLHERPRDQESLARIDSCAARFVSRTTRTLHDRDERDDTNDCARRRAARADRYRRDDANGRCRKRTFRGRWRNEWNDGDGGKAGETGCEENQEALRDE